MSFLRSGLLSERSIALGGELRSAVQGRLTVLGAQTRVCPVLDEDGLLEWAKREAPLDALVVAGRDLESMVRTWSLISAVASGAMIPTARGAIVLIAPARGDVEHGQAVRAALENLARTLSVEWSRFGMTTTAIAPSAATSDEDLAGLVAYLCSPAGSYLSGCCFELNPLGSEPAPG